MNLIETSSDFLVCNAFSILGIVIDTSKPMTKRPTIGGYKLKIKNYIIILNTRNRRFHISFIIIQILMNYFNSTKTIMKLIDTHQLLI